MGWNYGGRKSELKFTEDREVHDIIIFFLIRNGKKKYYRIYPLQNIQKYYRSSVSIL